MKKTIQFADLKFAFQQSIESTKKKFNFKYRDNVYLWKWKLMMQSLIVADAFRIIY